jgi:MoaA/NifB/PqqE/SkfB family radical SAM enzyme
MIFNKSGSAYDLGIKLADKVNEWLQQYNDSVKVHMGSDGDPFASHVYRHFMQTTPRHNNIKYSILTNGLMFKEFHPRVPEVMDNLNDLGISIDGATKKTYEKLRLGGKWEKILENLEAMAEAKNKYNFNFVFHFVVQKDNFHEMENIIDLAEKYNADHVWLNKIEDWGTMENFDGQNIWNSDEFKSYLEKVIARIHARADRFIECPTLISEAVRYRNKN